MAKNNTQNTIKLFETAGRQMDACLAKLVIFCQQRFNGKRIKTICQSQKKETYQLIVALAVD